MYDLPFALRQLNQYCLSQFHKTRVLEFLKKYCSF